MHQDNHFSKLRQVIEARNRTRGIELDAIFLDHRCPIAFMFVLGNMWVEDLGIRSDVHLKVKGRGHVIELVAMTFRFLEQQHEEMRNILLGLGSQDASGHDANQ